MKTYECNVDLIQYLLIIVTKIKDIRRNAYYDNTYHWESLTHFQKFFIW